MSIDEVQHLLTCLDDIRQWLSALFYLGVGWSCFYFGKWLFSDWR